MSAPRPTGDPAAEEWSQWSMCSLTCGQGWQVRTRSCVSSPYGTLCSGALRETRMCNNTSSCPGEPGIVGSGTCWPFFFLSAFFPHSVVFEIQTTEPWQFPTHVSFTSLQNLSWKKREKCHSGWRTGIQTRQQSPAQPRWNKNLPLAFSLSLSPANFSSHTVYLRRRCERKLSTQGCVIYGEI